MKRLQEIAQRANVPGTWENVYHNRLSRALNLAWDRRGGFDGHLL
ncbi:MAG: hypothetical protein WB608_24670 [Terracidiphilus sp.]